MRVLPIGHSLDHAISVQCGEPVSANVGCSSFEEEFGIVSTIGNEGTLPPSRSMCVHAKAITHTTIGWSTSSSHIEH